MINPYQILGIAQDANKKEIQAAQLAAMKARKYKLDEIALATKQLMDPAKRLAADFMFPAKVKAKRLQKIDVEIPIQDFNWEAIDLNEFNSL